MLGFTFTEWVNYKAFILIPWDTWDYWVLCILSALYYFVIVIDESAIYKNGCHIFILVLTFFATFCFSTVRLWNVDSIKHKHLVKTKTTQGKKTIPTTCSYSKDGKLIAVACQDGSIQMWDYKRYVNVAKTCRNAHMNGTDTSCLTFSYDGQAIATRGGNSSIHSLESRI